MFYSLKLAMSSPSLQILETSKTTLIKCPFCGGDLLIDGEKYNCYTCFRTGNIVDFLAERDRVSHKRAEWQALKVKPSERDLREMFKCNKVAANYFAENLNGYYFKKRGLTDETQKSFLLGYASSDGEELYKTLLDAHIDKDVIYNSGLFYESEEGLKPFFKNRVIFPILDEKNRIVGFGGRRLNDESKAPKYINTPENSIFHKRDILYGLNKALGNETIYFVEGYMDVIAMHQAGIINSVAALGTAIGEHHCSLLKECGVKNIILTMDGDDAGVKSAMRSIPIIRRHFNVSVVKLNNAKDPDEFIKAYGKDAFLQLEPQNCDAFYVQHSPDVLDAVLKILL